MIRESKRLKTFGNIVKTFYKCKSLHSKTLVAEPTWWSNYIHICSLRTKMGKVSESKIMAANRHNTTA